MAATTIHHTAMAAIAIHHTATVAMVATATAILPTVAMEATVAMVMMKAMAVELAEQSREELDEENEGGSANSLTPLLGVHREASHGLKRGPPWVP